MELLHGESPGGLQTTFSQKIAGYREVFCTGLHNVRQSLEQEMRRF